jgi:hypothetical protein
MGGTAWVLTSAQSVHIYGRLYNTRGREEKGEDLPEFARTGGCVESLRKNIEATTRMRRKAGNNSPRSVVGRR